MDTNSPSPIVKSNIVPEWSYFSIRQGFRVEIGFWSEAALWLRNRLPVKGSFLGHTDKGGGLHRAAPYCNRIAMGLARLRSRLEPGKQRNHPTQIPALPGVSVRSRDFMAGILQVTARAVRNWVKEAP